MCGHDAVGIIPLSLIDTLGGNLGIIAIDGVNRHRSRYMAGFGTD